MNATTLPSWEANRTAETRHVEDLLRQAGFAKVTKGRQGSS